VKILGKWLERMGDNFFGWVVTGKMRVRLSEFEGELVKAQGRLAAHLADSLYTSGIELGYGKTAQVNLEFGGPKGVSR
jgi:hypothetical protein